jgi:Flp pilus assembly pilin Flp
MKVLKSVAILLWREDRGQDVAEYCLMTALVALIALGIFWHLSGGLQGMWTSLNASLAAGNASGQGTGLAGN